jgi:arginase
LLAPACAVDPGHQPIDLSQLVYCGIRDFEPGQREKVEAHGIEAVYGGADGINFADALIPHLDTTPTKVLIHLDLDCLDTSVGQANDYAAPGGLSADQLSLCVTQVANRKSIAAMTIASFDPDLPGSDAIAHIVAHSVQRLPANGS